MSYLNALWVQTRPKPIIILGCKDIWNSLPIVIHSGKFVKQYSKYLIGRNERTKLIFVMIIHTVMFFIIINIIITIIDSIGQY